MTNLRLSPQFIHIPTQSIQEKVALNALHIQVVKFPNPIQVIPMTHTHVDLIRGPIPLVRTHNRVLALARPILPAMKRMPLSVAVALVAIDIFGHLAIPLHGIHTPPQSTLSLFSTCLSQVGLLSSMQLVPSIPYSPGVAPDVLRSTATALCRRILPILLAQKTGGVAISSFTLLPITIDSIQNPSSYYILLSTILSTYELICFSSSPHDLSHPLQNPPLLNLLHITHATLYSFTSAALIFS